MAREKLTPGANGHLTFNQVDVRTNGWTPKHFKLATPLLLGRAKQNPDRASGFFSLTQVLAEIGGNRERAIVAREKASEVRAA